MTLWRVLRAWIVVGVILPAGCGGDDGQSPTPDLGTEGESESESEGEGEGGQDLGVCRLMCATQTDCASGQFACREGYCVEDCSAFDCTYNSSAPTAYCAPIDDISRCVLACTADNECTGGSCSGEDNSGGSFCVFGSMTDCTSDLDCGVGYGDTCQTDLGICGCEDDSECSTQFADTCI